MKRLMFLFVCLFSAVFTIKASDDKPITFEQLPQVAQEFVKSNFAERSVLLAKVDSDLLDKSYEVLFDNGDKIEFDKKGVWESVECENSAVPDKVVPTQIMDYVKKNYPNVIIKKIGKEDRGGYEVELSNRLELKFNSTFKLVDIDS